MEFVRPQGTGSVTRRDLRREVRSLQEVSRSFYLYIIPVPPTRGNHDDQLNVERRRSFRVAAVFVSKQEDWRLAREMTVDRPQRSLALVHPRDYISNGL